MTLAEEVSAATREIHAAADRRREADTVTRANAYISELDRTLDSICARLDLFLALGLPIRPGVAAAAGVMADAIGHARQAADPLAYADASDRSVPRAGTRLSEALLTAVQQGADELRWRIEQTPAALFRIFTRVAEFGPRATAALAQRSQALRSLSAREASADDLRAAVAAKDDLERARRALDEAVPSAIRSALERAASEEGLPLSDLDEAFLAWLDAHAARHLLVARLTGSTDHHDVR
jgi:hypothetical protein